MMPGGHRVDQSIARRHTVPEELIIDTHIHIYPTRELGFQERASYEVWEYGEKDGIQYSEYGGDITDVVRALKDAGATRGVLVNLFQPESAPAFANALNEAGWAEPGRSGDMESSHPGLSGLLIQSNEWFCRMAAEHPELVAFIGMHPSAMTGTRAQEHMRKMVEDHGARGLKLHPVVQGFHLLDESMQPILRACLDLDIPIISHSGPARGGEQLAEPDSYAPALERYPGLRLVLAHLGGGAWKQTAEFARRYPGVAFDCSEIIQWTGAPNGPTADQLAQLILDIGPERVMMGSDFPWYGIGHTAQRVKELPLLSDAQKEPILGENARRILGV
jgi:predicted TIM-barrel fold metal-dependent hydrolase